MKKITLLLIFLNLLASCTNEKELKYLDSNLTVNERLDDLILRMTLEEKVAQMVL